MWLQMWLQMSRLCREVPAVLCKARRDHKSTAIRRTCSAMWMTSHRAHVSGTYASSAWPVAAGHPTLVPLVGVAAPEVSTA